MLTKERQNTILNELENKGAVTVTELVEQLGASESTIRRDLAVLDKMGKLQKVYGGATAIEHEYVTGEYDVHTKSQLCIEEKRAIAQYAATTIQDEDFVYIDAGTSTQMLIEAITNSRATFVTNGIVHAKMLIARGCKTYVLSGLVKPATEAIIGADAINSMKKYNFTKAFLGTNGIHTDYGYTTVDTEEAMVKQEAVNNSYVSYILADHTKFGKVTSVSFAPIRKSCIITDRVTKQKYKEATFVKEVLAE